MPHILKNKNLEVHIDLPNENYSGTRFDWSGKIVEVKFKGISIGTVEEPNHKSRHKLGTGFYNEFGIDSPLGYDQTKKGDWFHKIGVGLLKKTEDEYSFAKNYEARPCDFSIQKEVTHIQFECTSQLVNGYAYFFKKKIELVENGFKINYVLKNIGDKPIVTTEYNHNFLAIENELIGKDYTLKFPFILNTNNFEENVNPENYLQFIGNKLSFLETPKKVFFFSFLNGSDKVKAGWKLENAKLNIGIEEIGDFLTSKINLWGWSHVISPELFFDIALKSGESVSWSRYYNCYKLRS